jgi:hypothetical protein
LRRTEIEIEHGRETTGQITGAKYGQQTTRNKKGKRALASPLLLEYCYKLLLLVLNMLSLVTDIGSEAQSPALDIFRSEDRPTDVMMVLSSIPEFLLHYNLWARIPAQGMGTLRQNAHINYLRTSNRNRTTVAGRSKIDHSQTGKKGMLASTAIHLFLLKHTKAHLDLAQEL